jgi:hypothetical protein
MGYRSRVRGCVYGDAEQVDLYIVKHKMQYGDKNVFEYFDTAREDKGVYHEGISFKEKEAWTYTNDEGIEKTARPKYKIVDLEGSDWKWYEDYEDVKMWHKFMEEAEEFGLMYEFVRCGESTDDIEDLRSNENENFLYQVTDIACEY